MHDFTAAVNTLAAIGQAYKSALYLFPDDYCQTVDMSINQLVRE